MSTLKVRKANKALISKLGFERRDSHHRIYRLYLDDRLVARTFISHGQRELTSYHSRIHFQVGQMAKQMRLSRREFLDAVRCPLDREAYHTLIRQRLLP